MRSTKTQPSKEKTEHPRSMAMMASASLSDNPFMAAVLTREGLWCRNEDGMADT